MCNLENDYNICIVSQDNSNRTGPQSHPFLNTNIEGSSQSQAVASLMMSL